MATKETEKKSRFAKFMDFVKGNQGTQEVSYKEETLAGYGVKVASDGKLEERKNEYLNFLMLFGEEDYDPNQSLLDYLKDQMDKLKLLNACVLRVGGIYATAGSDARFAKLMRGWDKLYYNAISKGNRAMDFWTKDTTRKRADDSMDAINVRNYRQYLNNLVFPDGQDVLNYCFRREDVRERGVVLIQTMMPMMGQAGGGETMTSSGGRTSEDGRGFMKKPDHAPVPPRVPNTT